jgi:hypothetical protein
MNGDIYLKRAQHGDFCKPKILDLSGCHEDVYFLYRYPSVLKLLLLG